MTLWLVLVVLLCAEAKTPAEDVVVELGQNVMLNCSVSVSKTFWFMKVHSGIQSCISRIMDPDGKIIYYYVFNHANKFLIQGNKLQVLNITSQDQRVYCCGEKPQGNTVQCKDTYRLKTSPNEAETNVGLNPSAWREQLVFCSIGLCVAFVTVVTALMASSLSTSDAETLVTVQYQGDWLTDRDPGPAGPSVPVPPRRTRAFKTKDR